MFKAILILLSFVVAFFAGVAILMEMSIATHQYVLPGWYGYVAGVIVMIPTLLFAYKVAGAV